MTTQRELKRRTLDKLTRLLMERRDAALSSAEGFFSEAYEAQSSADNSDRLDRASPIGTSSDECYALAESAHALAEDADAALRRIAAGTYGMCSGCGDPIPYARLLALPTATRCVGCAGRHAKRRTAGIGTVHRPAA